MDLDPRLEGIYQDLSRPENRSANYQRTRSVPFRIEQDIRLVAAARQRDIVISGYIRRATLSFVAFDLGMTYDEISLGEWPVGHFGERGVHGANARRMHGRGVGRWQITGLTNK